MECGLHAVGACVVGLYALPGENEGYDSHNIVCACGLGGLIVSSLHCCDIVLYV